MRAHWVDPCSWERDRLVLRAELGHRSGYERELSALARPERTASRGEVHSTAMMRESHAQGRRARIRERDRH